MVEVWRFLKVNKPSLVSSDQRQTLNAKFLSREPETVMSDSPLSKKQKVLAGASDDDSQVQESPNNTRQSRSRTPRKLVLGSPDKRFAYSQPSTASSLEVPNLKPQKGELSSSRGRVYSQSPPRSPNRSPTRRLELIQLSPLKKSRLELQRIYDSQASMEPVERLCIDRLVLHNFKSYAGTQVVGPFHSSFSAVVGPNGSGKSNVIDSMLFVFGFRANKMRQGKLSDLIHKSEAHPNLDSCFVEIHFKHVIDEPNGNTRTSENSSPLVVTRKAFKNNSSKYFINGKESNYTQVTHLLKGKGIDLDHKRFLILQGEVESIAQMKPKAEKESDDGLLEYLEDIIGTAKYKPLIEKSLTEIETLNEVCKEKESRFEFVEREKISLESSKDEALNFLEKEKVLTTLKSSLCQHKIWKNDEKLKNTLEKSKELNDELARESAKYVEHQNEIKKLEEECSSLKNQMKMFAEQQKKLMSEKGRREREKVSKEEKAKNLIQKKSKAEKLSKTTKTSISEAENKLKELESSQLQYEEEVAQLNTSLCEERGELDKIKLSLKDKTSEITSRIKVIEKELEPWTVRLQEKITNIRLTESTITVLKESEQKLVEDITQTVKNIQELRTRAEEKQMHIKKLEKEQDSMKELISIGQNECDGAAKKLEEMKAVLLAHRQRSMDAHSSLSSYENKNKVLNALTRLQKSGRISGFNGRLGDLGIIDDKYDVAISTACPRLDDIVVDTVECGQQCIEHLRKNNLGYARFILLDKLRNFNTNSINTPENVPRIFDLIEAKEQRFIPAFYSVLRDTLVAKDLNQANRVAYGRRRFRVVTLDGKLIDISGTMSGGGHQKARGMMKSKRQAQSDNYTPDEIARIDSELAEREKNFKIASETLREMEETLQRYKDREPNIHLDVAKLKMDLESLFTDISLSEKRLSSLEEARKLHEEGNKELHIAQAKLDSLKQERTQLEEEMKSKNKEMKSLQDEIMKAGGTKLQMQNSKVDSLTQRITIVVEKQKRDRISQKKAENDLRRWNKQHTEATLEMEKCQEDLSSINESISELAAKCQEMEALISEAESSKEEKEEQYTKLQEIITEKGEDSNGFKSFELDIKNRLEKLNDLASQIRKDAKKLSDKLDSLKIREVTVRLDLLDDGVLPPAEENSSLHDDETQIPSNPNTVGDSMDIDDTSEINNDRQLNSEEYDDAMAVDQLEDRTKHGLPKLSKEELDTLDVEKIEEEIKCLEDFVLNTQVDIDILEEYAKRLAEFKTRKLDLNQAVEKRDKVRETCEELKKNRLNEFMNGFNVISMTLKEMYQMITMGGNAELELVDSLDPFSEGVLFSVMPPKKSWRNISNLSGGEKTLSSLALVFALHKYKPTPLYVMDEIDAALDFRNVSIVASYIKERTKNAQFVVISLRNNMFELAQQLVGIYKNKNMTKSVTLQNKDLITRI